MVNAFGAGLLIALFSMAALGASEPSGIDGTVRGSDGKPVRDANVRLDVIGSKIAPLSVRTDATGKYHFGSLNAGLYRITVLFGSTTLATAERVQINGTRQVDFQVKPGTAGVQKKTKHMVWVPPETGSNLGGRFVEVPDGDTTVPGAQNLQKAKGDALRAPEGGGH